MFRTHNAEVLMPRIYRTFIPISKFVTDTVTTICNSKRIHTTKRDKTLMPASDHECASVFAIITRIQPLP
jgi:hypothetical protein